MSSYPTGHDLKSNDQVEIETPENIVLKYQVAGLGERINAIVIDSLLLGLFLFLVIFAMAMAYEGIASDDMGVSDMPEEELAGAITALATVLFGFSSFLYFGLQEWIMSGKTLGKRAAHIRVVKINGFKLDFLSIFIRNIFRVIDHVPPFALVPLFNAKHRRLGDLVAGTLVVMESQATLSPLRTELLSLPLANRTFRFDQTQLKHLVQRDYEVIETILQRLSVLQPDRRTATLQAACQSLARRMGMDMPPEELRETYLRDLLQTEYHRQNRQLG